jgi:mannose-6-phosphate isomerase-like protein (cupin superfamily)
VTRLVEDPVLKHRLSFEPVDDGKALRVEMWVDPGGGVPPHVHPSMEEKFEVLSGELSLLSGRRWSVAQPGETVVVAAGTRHAYRNNGTVETHAICTAAPPQSLQEFLEEAAAMGRAGKLTRSGLPKTPGAAVQAAKLAVRHRKMVMMRWLV